MVRYSLNMSKKLISIVTPVFNEEKNIKDCYDNVKNFFKNKTNYKYEHIFVDNNSKDKTKSILKKLNSSDKRVVVIFNKKNYQVLPSIYNSIKFAKGDAILLCYAADGQDPIVSLKKYLYYYEKGFKVISAQRTMRNESIFWQIIKLTYYFIYINFNRNKNIRDKKHYFTNVFQLVDRSIVRSIFKSKVLYPHLPSLTYKYSNEDEIISIKSKWISRKKGKSYNSILNYIAEAFYAITCYTFFIEFFLFCFFISVFIFDLNFTDLNLTFVNVLILTIYGIQNIYMMVKFSNKKILSKVIAK